MKFETDKLTKDEVKREMVSILNSLKSKSEELNKIIFNKSDSLMELLADENGMYETFTPEVLIGFILEGIKNKMAELGFKEKYFNTPIGLIVFNKSKKKIRESQKLNVAIPLF